MNKRARKVEALSSCKILKIITQSANKNEISTAKRSNPNK